jgi:FAD/FMN-containing dehydrogenase
MALASPTGFRGVFRTDESARAVYSEAAGIGRTMPRAVAVVSDADDVSALVRWSRETGHPLIPRGSGSSQAGGAIGDGVIVDVTRLRAVGIPDAQSRRVRVEAGVLRGEVDRAAAAIGLRFPVDPSSGAFCTIGGMAATNAAGPHSLQHGATRRWISALECVFDDGSRATVRRGSPVPNVPAIRRFTHHVAPAIAAANPADLARAGVRKDSSGYGVSAFAAGHDLVDLLAGSEGTLAIITAVELMLAAAPSAVGSCLLAFDDLGLAVEAAVTARDRGASACELLDRTFIDIARTGGHPLPVPASTDAVLLIEVEGFDAAAVSSEAERLFTELRAMGATTKVSASELRGETELWSFRHAASPALAKFDKRLKSMQFIEDAAFAPERVAEYVRGVRDILAAAGTAVVIFGHAGDAHIHVNPLVDVSDPRWRDRVDTILSHVTDLVARLGGTMAGEHGDGRIRAPLMSRTWSPVAMQLFAAVKHAFDPFGILNPGVKVAMRGQRPIDAVKYDPSLPPLPEGARRALETVERDRAYSRLRLDLL